MSSIKDMKPHKVAVYIDGFNVYFGLRKQGWKYYYWLDYQGLAVKLASKVDVENPILVATKYFTSRISTPFDKRKRQSDYFEVLAARGGIDFYFGNYKDSHYDCTRCGGKNALSNEKQTDVNIAVQMMVDAYENKFDTAILIGGDSDLVPPIREIRRLFPAKRVMCCFPPNRFSNEVKNATNAQMFIHEADYKNNQLPDEIRKPDGYLVRCPDTWK